MMALHRGWHLPVALQTASEASPTDGQATKSRDDDHDNRPGPIP